MCVRRMCVCTHVHTCCVLTNIRMCVWYGAYPVSVYRSSKFVCVMCVCVLTVSTPLRPCPRKLSHHPNFCPLWSLVVSPTRLSPPPPYYLAVYSSE